MAETSSFSSFKTAFTQLNKKDIRLEHKRSTHLYAENSEPESTCFSDLSISLFFPWFFTKPPSPSDTCLHSVRILPGMPLGHPGKVPCPQHPLGPESKTYCQQLTLPTVIHIGAQHVSRARAQCALVISSLRRGESVSHGQMLTLQVHERTKMFLRECLAGERDHESAPQAGALRLLSSTEDGLVPPTDYNRTELRNTHTIPTTRPAFEAEKCQWGVNYSTSKARSGQRHSIV